MISGIGLKTVYKLSNVPGLNRAANFFGNTLHAMRINYALGATRAAAVLHCSGDQMEISKAIDVLNGLIKGKTYVTYHPYSEDYAPPKGELSGRFGVMSLGSRGLEIAQTHYIGKRPEKAKRILGEPKQPAPFQSTWSDFFANPREGWERDPEKQNVIRYLSSAKLLDPPPTEDRQGPSLLQRVMSERAGDEELSLDARKKPTSWNRFFNGED